MQFLLFYLYIIVFSYVELNKIRGELKYIHVGVAAPAGLQSAFKTIMKTLDLLRKLA
jgi:hypothetical protein